MDKAAICALAQAARTDLEKKAHLCLQALRGPRLPGGTGLRQDQLLHLVSRRGEDTVCRKAACRYFMELAGIRYMEVNGCLPQRVLSPAAGNELPQILESWLSTHADTLDRDEIYTRLFRRECARLHQLVPDFFPKPDCTDLLLSLSYRHGAAALFRDSLPEDAWKDQIEIIGWLYQYYHLQEKNAAIDVYRGAVKMRDVPAATQFFTTDWVVKYMVQNTLGRVWLEGHPDSRLRTKMPYFLDTPQKATRSPMNPEDLHLLENKTQNWIQIKFA